MQQKSHRALWRSLLVLIFLPVSGLLRAADGFDNNYFGSDANTLLVTLNDEPKALLFGPGNLSTGGFNLHVPNGSFRDLGVVSSFSLNQVISHLRSAYSDRVTSTTLYYRVFVDGYTPPDWSTLTLQPENLLHPDSCYSTSQNNSWSTAASINFLAGLAPGGYVLEFYIQSELYDVGAEGPDPCNINASLQCSSSDQHTDRFISSRFTATDPTACNLPNLLANLANPSRVTFLVNTVAVSGPALTSVPALDVWPNPAVAMIQWQNPEVSTQPLMAWIINPAGQVLRRQTIPLQTPANLPIGDLSEGLYLLILYDERGNRVGQSRFLKTN